MEDNTSIKGSVKLQEIVFKYTGRDKLLFEGLNLSVPEGHRIALVGASGSGKSTIVNLIFRLYQPLSGKILIDDTNINNISNHNLKQQIGIVSQEPSLFNRSIFDNVKYNQQQVGEAEVVAALRKANAY
jgi:ABC-type multidrug transport system fused ATPase/permease subunit